MLLAVIFSVLGSSHADVKGGSILQDGARAASVAGTSVLHETSGNTSMEMTSAPARMLSGQASPGCHKCCSEQDCTEAFRGSPGMCCRATPATCCPNGYTCAAPAGCRRNHTFGGGNRFNPGMSQHSLGGGNMSLLRRSTLPCPLWVGTNTTPICLTGDPLLQIGACYNVSNGMAQVTCIQALKENGERRNLTNYVNFQCSPGSEDKCLFQKSYGTLLNSSVTVQEKFEAAPIVFKGVNSKLVGLGIMAGLASLTGGAAVLVLRRVKVYFANSGRTESLIEEPDESLEE